MPKYCYRCKNCEYQFEVRHAMRDRLYDCEKCGLPEVLVRIPQLVYKQSIEPEKTGSLVKEYIEKNREVLKEQKKEALEGFKEP